MLERERGLCVNDAPKLATEMEAERAALQVQQMRETMATEHAFSGDTSTRTTVCTNCGKPVGSEKFCSNCGTPVGLAKCANCGNDLAAGGASAGTAGPPPRRSGAERSAHGAETGARRQAARRTREHLPVRGLKLTALERLLTG